SRPPRAPVALELHVEEAYSLPHLRRRGARPQRVVLVERRHAEHADDRVADVLLDPAAVSRDRPAHLLVEARLHLPDRLGIQLLAHLGRADDVAEDGRHELPRLARRARERRRTGTAEAETRRVLSPSLRADGHPARVRRHFRPDQDALTDTPRPSS